MNLVLDYKKYNVDNIFFYDPVKNTVMDDSKFIRIIYSDVNIILNGLYLKILRSDNIDELSENIDKIENNILMKYHSIKSKSMKIKEQLLYILKKNPYDNIFILKISGIWETDMMIGVTYKFILDNTLTIS
jgi:hypothetical protein